MEKGLRRTRTRRRFYIQVIVDIILWLSVFGSGFFLYGATTPYTRGFFCDDKSIQYPYRPSTTSGGLVALIGLGSSLAVVVIVEVLNRVNRLCRSSGSLKPIVMYVIKCYGVYQVGYVVLQTFVVVMKQTTGCLRPNFMDLCRPEFNQSLCQGYVTDYTCTGNSSDANHARQSFPSGHAAFAMYTATYFSIYIHRQLRISFSRVLKIFLQMALLLGASVIGFLRVVDHEHHTSDVIAGILLGAFLAAMMYKTMTDRIPAPGSRRKPTDSSDGMERDSSQAPDPTTPTSLLDTRLC